MVFKGDAGRYQNASLFQAGTRLPSPYAPEAECVCPLILTVFHAYEFDRTKKKRYVAHGHVPLIDFLPPLGSPIKFVAVQALKQRMCIDCGSVCL